MPEDDIQAGEGTEEETGQLVPDSSSDTTPDIDADAPASATETRVEEGDTDTGDGTTTGAIPPDRHKAVLENTRQEYEQKLNAVAWANGFSREQVERAVQIANYYDNNPQGLIEHLSKHVKTPEKPTPITPDFQTVTEEGERIALFSADRVAQLVEQRATEIADARVRALEERLGPIEASTSAAARAAHFDAQIEAAAEWPGFTDNIAQITEALAKANQEGRTLSLEQAYIQVVLPKMAADKETLTAEAKKAVLAEMNDTTERASGGVDPEQKPAKTRKKDSDKSWGELFQEELTKASA